MQIRRFFSQPAVEAALVIHLSGENERFIPQVLGGDGVLFCQRTAAPHQNTPRVFHGQLQIAILRFIDISQENSKVQQSLIQAFTHIHGIAADDVKQNVRITLLNRVGNSGDLPDPIGLAGADVNIAADRLIRLSQFFFGSAHQIQNFFRPLSQQHAVLGECDFPVAPDHQLFAQLLLQLPELSGECGLGQMQGMGCR